MMNQNSTLFLEAFVVIEAYLASISDLAKGVPFVAQVDSLRLTDQTVQAYAEDLKAFARLRNVIVHERGGGVVLAEPNDWAVQRISHVRDMLIQPPTVAIFATHKVLTIRSDDHLAAASRLMYEHHYSQLPVYGSNGYEGLLTIRNITYWIGAQSSHLLDLSQVRVSAVLRHTEPADTALFVKPDASLVVALNVFAAQHRRGNPIDAVLISESGTAESPLLGIIALADMPAIAERLRLSQETVRTPGPQ
jgi:predicted transcriptional regulator